MSRTLPALLAAACLAAVPAVAHHGGHGAPSGRPGQPYAELEARRVKALGDEQAADLLAGRGMGLALAAELNGYPGPMHVLEHADKLRLTPTQQATAEGLRQRMAAEARTLGARIVALESELGALFASGAADAGRLGVVVMALGALNGRLRETHLVSHIAMRDALDREQRESYARLRGYAVAPTR